MNSHESKTSSSKEKCVYCLEVKKLTRDHVISQCLFPEGYPKEKIITVRGCSSCNFGFSLDEEYFRNFIVNISVEHSKEAEKLFYTKIKRSIQRRPKIGHKALKSMDLVNLYTKDGIYLGKKTKINISQNDWARHHNILDKYIKGLFFSEFQVAMPKNYKMKHILGSKHNQGHKRIINHLNRWNKDNQEVIVYGFNFIPESFESIWITIYFDSVFFITFVVPEEKYVKFENAAKNKK